MSKHVRLISIRWSLIRNIGLLILALAGSILTVSMMRSKSMVERLCQDLFHRTATQTDLEFHRFFDPVTSSLGIVGRWAEAGTVKFNDIERTNSLIEPLLEHAPQILALTTGDARGSSFHFLNVDNGWQNRLVTIDDDGKRSVEKWLWEGADSLTRHWSEDDSFDPRARPWYKDVVSMLESGGQFGDLVWTPPYVFFSTLQPGITVARMTTQPNGEHTVVSMDVHLIEITRYVQSLSLTPNGYAFVANEDGKLVGLPEHENITEQQGLSEVFAQDPASLGMDATVSLLAHAEGPRLRPLNSIRYKSEGAWYWGCVRPIEVPGVPRFYFGVVVPELDFLTESHRHHTLIFALSGIMLLVASWVAVILAKHYSAPLRSLAASHERLRRLDTSEAPKVRTRLREVALLDDAHGRTCAALDSFARYIPRELVRDLLDRGEAAKIGSRLTELTLVFLDIEGFTALSERIGPQRTVQRLSTYFEMMIGCLKKHGGTIDKLIGDAVFSFWGAPEDQPDRCRRALTAVLDCHHSVHSLNDDLIAHGQAPLPTRFGIATGTVMVGNIGSPSRINYTALGHEVNLASRLEALNSHYGTSIIVDGTTFRRCEHEFDWRHLDTVRVKGSATPEPIYELLGAKGSVHADEMTWSKLYEKALHLYCSRKFDQALTMLDELSQSTPSDVSVQRLSAMCKECVIRLPRGWDGVTRF